MKESNFGLLFLYTIFLSRSLGKQKNERNNIDLPTFADFFAHFEKKETS